MSRGILESWGESPEEEISMEKAYDVSVLLAGLKGRGLDLAEESAKIVLEEVLSWVEKSAVISANPYDNMALIILPELKKQALGLVDKIDGQEG